MLQRAKGFGRVNAQRLQELPEGHRTTYVVGVIDMMHCSTKYMEGHTKEAWLKLLSTIDDFESGDVRRQFDEYLAESDDNGRYGAASSFLAMLITNSGILDENSK